MGREAAGWLLAASLGLDRFNIEEKEAAGVVEGDGGGDVRDTAGDKLSTPGDVVGMEGLLGESAAAGVAADVAAALTEG